LFSDLAHSADVKRKRKKNFEKERIFAVRDQGQFFFKENLNKKDVLFTFLHKEIASRRLFCPPPLF
jgi:hypothetical protein